MSHCSSLLSAIVVGVKLMQIPVMRPRVTLPQKALDRLESVALSGVFSNFGPQVLELESRLASLLRVPPAQVVSTANGTLGLVGAMTITGVQNWELPAWTFAATGHAASAAGVSFRFGDVNQESWMLDFGEGISSDEGKLLVLPFGAGLDVCWWDDDAEVVIDAAASLGSLAEFFPRIPRRTAIVVSLHATKVLGVGEGGFVVFGDSSRAKEFRSWTNFGFAGSRESLSRGINAKMSEYMAALLNSELDSWAANAEAWARARELVDAASNAVGMTSPANLAGGISPYWITVWSDENERNQVAELLSNAGVETRKWWGSGLHKMRPFEGIRRSGLQNTDCAAGTYLGLPFFRDISEGEVGYITSVISART